MTSPTRRSSRLERLNADGSLDNSFGNGTGVVTTQLGKSLGSEADAVAELPGGKLLVAGQADGGNAGFALARYNPDGSLDKSFGTGGVVLTSFGGTDNAKAIALMSSGKFVIAGTDQFGDAQATPGRQFALARYNADGSLDKTFGAGGKVTTKFGGGPVSQVSADSLLVTPVGTVYVAGSAGDPNAGGSGFALARYTPAGRLDPSFNHGAGTLTTALAGLNSADVISLGPGGKITLAGDADGDFAMARYNADGTLDIHFGTSGKLADSGPAEVVTARPGGGYVSCVNVSFSSQDKSPVPRLYRFDANGSPLPFKSGAGVNPQVGFQATALAVASDGKILAAGSNFLDAVVARFGADGSVDTSFNAAGSGYAVTPVGEHGFGTDSNAAANAEAVLPNGDILVAGYADAPGSDFALVRYKPNGRLDTTFGSGTGIALTPFPGDASAAAMAVLPSGKILLAGQVAKYSEDGQIVSSYFAAAEYLPDGRPDLSFGRGGLITTPLPGDATAAALAVLPNGRFVIAGTTFSNPHSHFIFVRYYPNGTVDNSFGSGGVSITAEAPNATALAMALLPGNKLLVAGSIGGDFGVVRYNPDGSVDKTFGRPGPSRLAPGVVTTDFGGSSDAHAIALAPGGKFILAGVGENGGGSFDDEFALARYNADGTLDATFGAVGAMRGTGKVVTQVNGTLGDSANAVAVQPNGKIVVGGVAGDSTFDHSYFTVARFNPDGSLDASFGPGGTELTTVFGLASDSANALVIQSDGKIDAAGQVESAAGTGLGVVRYLP